MALIKEILPDPSISQVAKKAPAAARLPAAAEERGVSGTAEAGQDILQLDRRRRDEAILEENAKILLRELPEVRPDRVEEARRKLDSDFYNRPEVLQETALKIQEDLASAQQEKVESEQVKSARSRMAHGYYEQSEVLEETARQIVKKQL